MEVILYLSMLSLIMLVLLVVIFFWAVNNNQNDDLESHGTRFLHTKDKNDP